MACVCALVEEGSVGQQQQLPPTVVYAVPAHSDSLSSETWFLKYETDQHAKHAIFGQHTRLYFSLLLYIILYTNNAHHNVLF